MWHPLSASPCACHVQVPRVVFKKTIYPETEAKQAMTEKELADHHQLHHGQRWGNAPPPA